MNDDDRIPDHSLAEALAGSGAEASPLPASGPPAKKDPAQTLNVALLVYIVVNSIFGVPLLVFPARFLDFVGVAGDVADELGGLRWVGAILMAWAISAILVLARPAGRAFFVTTGSLQMSVAGAAFAYSLLLDDHLGSNWFQVVAIVLWGGGAVVLWWARLRGRRVFTP